MFKVEVFSEFTQIKVALLHKPGKEVEYALKKQMPTLNNSQMWTSYMSIVKEHENLVKELINDKVKVLYISDLLIEIFENNHNLKRKFIKEFIEKSTDNISSDMLYRLEEYLLGFTNKAFINKIIEGVMFEELINDFNMQKSSSQFILNPLVNLIYIRDVAMVIGNDIAISNLNLSVRKRETLLIEYILKYNNIFEIEASNIIFNDKFIPSIEGGDILLVSEKVMCVGMSIRSDERAVLSFINDILKSKQNKINNIILIKIPKSYDLTHLDKIITQISEDKFLVYKPILNKLEIYRAFLETDKIKVTKVKENLEKTFSEIFNENVNFICVGNDNVIDSLKEQRMQGTNILTLSKNKVISFKENKMTNDTLEKLGIEVVKITGNELSKGFGGTRSLVLPLQRKNDV